MAFGEKRKALIIGINQYPKQPLKGCVNDATEMRRVLQKHAKGDPNFDCALRIEPGVTHLEAIHSEINNLLFGESDLTLAVLYFAGHGVVKNGRYQLCPVDYAENGKGIDLYQLSQDCVKSKVPEIVIILDSCQSGGAGNMPNHEIEVAELRKGLTILAATNPNGLAAETYGPHGKFTQLLIRGLEGGAMDMVGHITTASLYAYADSFLTLWEQKPMYKTHASGLTALRYGIPRLKKRILRRVTDYFPLKHLELDLSSQSDLAIQELRQLRRHGFIEAPHGWSIRKAARNGVPCFLTEAGKDLHDLVLKNRI